MAAARPAPTADDGRRRAARAAARHLRRVDPRFGVLIDHIGPHALIVTRDPFLALAGSIIQQQVSMAAAAAIQRRVRALCPRNRLTPRSVMSLSLDELRAAGLSRQKSQYLHNIAEAFASRRLTPAKLRRMSDDDVIAATTLIKGVGRWTAEMLLIFCLERPDVWPVDDLGLRKAVGRFFDLPELPTPAAIRDVADPWRPYRSYATWYLWRSLEGPLMPGVAL
jgi:DNA-3-methyladenine glycosylase II